MKWFLLRRLRFLVVGFLIVLLPSPPNAAAEEESCPAFNFREVFHFGYDSAFPTWTLPGIPRVITWSTMDSGELNGKRVQATFQNETKDWLKEAFQSWDEALDTISFSEIQSSETADIKIAWTQILQLDYESLFTVKAPAGLRASATLEFKYLSSFLLFKENFIQSAQSDIGHILGMGYITPKPELVSVMEWPFQSPYMQIPLGAFDVALVRAIYSESTCTSSFSSAIQAKIKQDAEAFALEQARVKAENEAKALAEKEERERQELYWIAKGKEIAELEARERASKAAALKKTTITCVKGKLTKKVTAVKPKCPTGFIVRR